VEVTRLLLEAGADVDPQDRHGNTPLGRAVFSSRGEGALIGLLRSRGANPHLSNAQGVSPLRLAQSIGNYDIAQFFQDLPDGEPGEAAP